MDSREKLKILKPRHEYFIGIDSDGCVFDSMEVKQKEFRKSLPETPPWKRG